MSTFQSRIITGLLCFSLLSLFTVGAQEASAVGTKVTKEKLHIYLLIGQSNMAGRAPFTAEEAEPIKGCLLFNAENRWEPATNPLNRHSTIQRNINMQKMSPGYGFAQTMVAESKGITIGLVSNARGNTSIEQWAKGTKYYDDAIKKTREAMKTGTLKGILWHQGEANSSKPKGYLEKLTQLIEDLRKDLDSPDLPFVAGQINRSARINPSVNEQIAKLPETVKSAGFVSSEGLKAMDRWHFDAPSTKLMGKRYAEEILKLQKSRF